MKTILVTGASGFIGFNLVKSLIKKHYRVKVLIRKKKLITYFEKLGIEIILGDFTPKTFEMATKDVNIIYHLAAERESKQDWKVYQKTNVTATKNLIKAAISNKVKSLIYLSTVHVYGFPQKLPANENAIYNPQTLYAKSKMLAELEVIKNRKKIDFTIVRSPLVYGPGDKAQFILKFNRLFNKFFGLILGNGKNRIHFIYINDLIKGLLLMLKDEAKNEIFLLCSHTPITANKLANTIFNLRKIKPFIINIPLTFAKLGLINKDTSDILTCDRFYSAQKAQEILGFKPETDYIDGLRSTLNWSKNEK